MEHNKICDDDDDADVEDYNNVMCSSYQKLKFKGYFVTGRRWVWRSSMIVNFSRTV